MSVSNVSSPAASRRSTILESQPLRAANPPMNSLIRGSADTSASTSSRVARGAVTSTNRVIRIASRLPAVMPFCSRPPATFAR